MAKIFAFDESKVLEAWSFMTRYRDHINEHCGWKRGFDPGIALKWHIRRKQTDGSFKGNNSQAKGFTTKQDPTNGVGGSAKVIFGEESGINPTLDKTHEFITSNVSYGGLTTGLILYSGAVGELDKAEPLKQYILHPEDNGFLSRPNNILEDVEFGDRVGFFAPEWWNYMSVERDEDDKPIGEGIRCFDEWGNSNKEFALREIEKWREREKKKSPEKYRYYCSQRPLSIKEAFAWRRESKFPQNLVQAQKRRIEDKTYPTEYVDIRQTPKGLEFIKTSALPISEFPLGRAVANKEGCIVIYERPIGTPELGKQYVASIDPVKEGKTSTSYSLFSIVIYKLDVEVIKYGEEVESWIEPGQIVAEWCGRFDDINKTHERAAFMLEMYQARAIVEANVSEFVNYMIGKRRQHYLVPKTQMLFLKELGANETSYQEYGWKNTGKIFENHLLRYAIEFLSEELSSETHANGSVVIKKYGIERIPSIMILKEMEAYQPGMNVDRLISFAALTAYIKIYLANVGYARREEAVEHKKPADKNLYAVPRSFFKNVGTVTSTDEKYQIKRSPFKNIK
jgi:hypothetical protein